MRMTPLALAAAGLTSLAAQAAPLMSTDWAVQACNYWNTNPALTTELAERWAKNDGGRGHKIIHMYRTDCGENTKVEMTISTKGGKTTCVESQANPTYPYTNHQFVEGGSAAQAGLTDGQIPTTTAKWCKH